MLLGVEADHVRGDVDDLLADTDGRLALLPLDPLISDIPDVTLLDQNTGMVDRLGQTKLVNAGLQTALKEILNAQGKDVIELHARLVEHTDTHETANQGIAFEQTLGVLLVEGEQLTGRVSFRSIARMERAYRAARRILDRVNWTRHTSRLLRRPYSPTIFSSESL